MLLHDIIFTGILFKKKHSYYSYLLKAAFQNTLPYYLFHISRRIVLIHVYLFIIIMYSCYYL